MNFPMPGSGGVQVKPDPEKNPARQCTNCFTDCRLLPHPLRHRGSLRRLCTACVLHLNPTSFCPLCFSFYDGTLPPLSKRVSCSGCPSSAHSHCAASAARPLSPFLCPACRDPSFSYFPKTDAINERMAVILLCAAKISAASMRKAVAEAKAEEDRKVREAALAKKRAREAIEHLIFISVKENERKIEGSLLLESIENNVELDGIDEDFVRDLEARLADEHEINAKLID